MFVRERLFQSKGRPKEFILSLYSQIKFEVIKKINYLKRYLFYSEIFFLVT